MAAEEHQKLAAYIKNVHQTLRIQSRRIGPEKAWEEHCSQKERLQKYAASMKELATKFWEQNSSDENSDAKCRIDWVVRHSIDYFMKGGSEKERLKEKKKEKVILSSQTPQHQDNTEISQRQVSRDDTSDFEILRLLDVGSCYNPFKIVPFFNVLPIDLVPASPDVFKCDFLNVEIVSKQNYNSEKNRIEESSCITNLPEDYFDIVVFCLLLEYLPSPQQRYNCCVKAFSLLKLEGLLFIITPDSKHATANAPIMKNWRIALGYLGFSKVYYEKLPHIHCMAYRKNCNLNVSRHWALQTMAKHKQSQSCKMDTYMNLAELLNIPQDSHEYNDTHLISEKQKEQRSVSDDELVVDMFSHLPNL